MCLKILFIKSKTLLAYLHVCTVQYRCVGCCSKLNKSWPVSYLLYMLWQSFPHHTCSQLTPPHLLFKEQIGWLFVEVNCKLKSQKKWSVWAFHCVLFKICLSNSFSCVCHILLFYITIEALTCLVDLLNSCVKDYTLKLKKMLFWNVLLTNK